MKWCAQGHRGCPGVHSGLLWTQDDLGYRYLESYDIEDEDINTNIMWEDTGSQCIDSRPNGQKTGQKKVALFATYSMVVIRNM